MHSKKKGKSGPTHPPAGITPSWCQYTKDEVEELVLQLAGEGKKMSEIGVILRDQHGIPSVKTLTGSSISEILKRNKVAREYPEDLMNLLRKAMRLIRHNATHKQDKHNLRALRLTESKIRRLSAYYRRSGALPESWFYKPEEVALIVKE